MLGSPRGTVPRVETPCSSRSAAALTTIAPTTANSAPGIFGETFFSTRIVPITLDGDGQRREARLVELPERVDELRDRLAAHPGDAEHPAELAQRDLDADAGQEPDEHRARQEVGDEAEPDEAGEDHERRPPSARAGRRGRCTRDEPVVARPASPAAITAAVAESAPTTRWRERAEDGEDHQRQDQRVQAGDHRHAGDVRVAHDLGDRQARRASARRGPRGRGGRGRSGARPRRTGMGNRRCRFAGPVRVAPARSGVAGSPSDVGAAPDHLGPPWDLPRARSPRPATSASCARADRSRHRPHRANGGPAGVATCWR